MDKHDKSRPRGAESDRGKPGDPTQRHARTRRRLLQSLTLGGAAVTVKALPERWTRPVANAVVLPAHAQATVCTLQCTVEGFESNTDATNLSADPPFNGGSLTEIDNLTPEPDGAPTTSSVTFSQISATVSGAGCGQPNLIPQADNEGILLDLDGGSLSNFDPGDGVAEFNPLTVALDLGAPQVGDLASADLTLTFTAAGAPDCVVNFTFTEDPVL